MRQIVLPLNLGGGDPLNADDGQPKKSAAQLRLLFSRVLERLEGVTPVAPEPGHFYRSLGGEVFYIFLLQPEPCPVPGHGDHVYGMRMADGRQITFQKTGDMWYTNLGVVLEDLDIDRWPILVQDMGVALDGSLHAMVQEDMRRLIAQRAKEAARQCRDDE